MIQFRECARRIVANFVRPITPEIRKLEDEAFRLMGEGKVEEAMSLTVEASRLREKRAAGEQHYIAF